MSHNHFSSTSSNFQLILDNALKTYKKCTKPEKDLLKHPLADRLQACDSPSSILTVLQEQVQELNESHCSNTKWLECMKDVHGWVQARLNRERPSHFLRDSWRRCRLGVLQDTNLSEICTHICLKVFSPAKVIFIGFGVLLSTAKAVRADQDALFEVFERIEEFFRRLDIYTEVAPNQRMADIITAMVEVLNFIGIATKEIKRGRTKKYLKKLTEKNDTEDALKRLDKLTQEEARMAAAQLLKVTNTIDNRVGGIADNMLVVDNRVAGIDDGVAGVDDRVMMTN